MSSSPPAREPGDRQQPLMWELTVFKSRAALGKVRVNRYLRANMVNLMYAVIMIVMDVAVYSNEFEGLAYLTLAVIHCVNAYMYLWVWRGEHQNIYTMFCLPDWLNGVCAAFYLGTGFCAPYMYDDNGSPTNIFVKVRRIELFLSVLECIAVVGWLYQWYALFVTDLRLRPRQCRGRGWTFDDPDMWANISLVIAAIYYIIYNIVICVDNYKYYDTSTLYFWGDFWYLINAVCYIVCALRDCECFWFMPLSGHFPDFDAMANECGLLNVEDGFASTASVTPTADDEKVLENTASKGLLSRILARQRSGSGSGQSEMSSGSADIDEEAVTPLLTSGVEGKQRV